jgi:hypothetical protein
MSRPLPQHRSLLRASASPVVVMRCGVSRRWSLLWLLLGLTLASPAWPDTVRCTTYEEKTLQRWHTICDDGTRAVSCYHQIVDRWETTITESPATRARLAWTRTPSRWRCAAALQPGDVSVQRATLLAATSWIFETFDTDCWRMVQY